MTFACATSFATSKGSVPCAGMSTRRSARGRAASAGPHQAIRDPVSTLRPQIYSTAAGPLASTAMARCRGGSSAGQRGRRRGPVPARVRSLRLACMDCLHTWSGRGVALDQQAGYAHSTRTRCTVAACSSTPQHAGEYRAEQAEHAPAAAPSANFCPDTAVAGTPGKMQAAKLNAAQPGPGSYDHATAHYSGAAVTWDGAPRGGHASAFRAADRVVDLATCKESPPPCLYNLTSVRGPHILRHAP